MHVYRVTCDIYVTADNADDAARLIGNAIEPYAPDMRTDDNDPSIDMLYMEATEHCPELHPHG